MNRPIKFRVYNTKTKEMFDDDFCQNAWKELLNFRVKSRWIIMQFTGLLDKNGKEIWEGDFVKHDESGNWEVRFRFGAWHLFGEYPGLLYPAAVGFDNGGKHSNLEIIGNIYESKHLLDNIDTKI